MDIEKIRENLLNGTVQGYLTINNVEYVLVNKVHYSEALAELDSVAPDSIQPEPPALSEVEGEEFVGKAKQFIIHNIAVEGIDYSNYQELSDYFKKCHSLILEACDTIDQLNSER